MSLFQQTPQDPTAAVLHRSTVRVVVSQTVDVEVFLPEPSALVAQDHVTEVLDADEQKLMQLDTHFGGHLTWHPCVWKVVSAEQCRTVPARAEILDDYDVDCGVCGRRGVLCGRCQDCGTYLNSDSSVAPSHDAPTPEECPVGDQTCRYPSECMMAGAHLQSECHRSQRED